ncbi:cache domain-containing protein [Halodesulfovibrio sp.]|uniref:cache domain-containing protein n=1 Tax=Halodesulfovibrio sp. TaxID=1912772 RepID=UPI0025EAA5CE|nr:cache domain-containing protein [Halodesulfovibrio sp.]MCT4535750.1 cache domain-containing protein [Halodesulfovibrio sp.]
MSDQPTITNKITLLLVFMFFFSATIGITYIYYMNKVKEDAVNESQTAMLTGYKRSLAYSIRTIADLLGNQLKDVPQKEKQAHVQQAIQELRYDTDGYYFVYNTKGVNIAHPLHPEFINTNRLTHKDQNGHRYIADLANAAQNGGGYTTYWFSKPDKKIPLPKLAYAQMIPDTDFWIATGIYIDTIDAEQQALVKKLETHVQKSIIIVSVGTTFVLFFLVVPASFYMINTIIQPWKQMERELRHAQKMEAIGIFAGGIAHDFNNILGAIISCSELALIDVKKHMSAHEDLRRILQAANRGKALVRKIKAFSTRNSTHVQLMRPATVLQECMRLLESFIPATIDVSVRNRCDAALIYADPDQYLQILMNLCTNAVQAMDGTKGSLHIELYVREVSLSEAKEMKISPYHYVALTVRDTGTGIPQHLIDQIFDPFYTTRKKVGGTGLGLSVISSIIKQNKGHISVQSTTGVGTSFTVLLPYAGKSTEEAPQQLNAVQVQGGTESILFVDDDKDLAYPVEKLFSHYGYNVSLFTNSQEALDAFRENPQSYDLLLTDQMMPHLTGTELIKEIHSVKPDMPTILYSGLEGSDLCAETPSEWEDLGVTRFFSKPFEPAMLCEAVRQLLNESCSTDKEPHEYTSNTHN